jgi:hypothetical protein
MHTVPAQPRSKAAFAWLIALLALAGYAVSAGALLASVAEGDLAFALGAGAWCTLPVLWWAAWASLTCLRHPGRRGAVLTVGSLLAGAFAIFHALAWSAAHSDSSTGAFGYVTIPPVLLVGTIVTTCIVSGSLRSRGR